jgi:hypothetical protein
MTVRNTAISAIRKGTPMAESDKPPSKNDELWQQRPSHLLSKPAVVK